MTGGGWYGGGMKWTLSLVIGVVLAGCIERRPPRDDAPEADRGVGDGAALDEGGAEAGAAGRDAGDDAMVDAMVDAILDAMPDATPDAMPDATPDAEILNGEGPLATTVGRGVCPAVARVGDGWFFAAASDGDAFDDRQSPDLVVLGVDGEGRVRERWVAPALLSSITALRLVPHAAGVAALVGGRGFEAGPGVGAPAELWWVPVRPRGEPVRLRSEAGGVDPVFDAVAAGEGVAVLHGLDGGLTLARLVDGRLGEGRRIDDAGAGFARLAAAGEGFVAAWGGRGRLVVAATDGGGAVQWRHERPIAAEPAGLRVRGAVVEVGVAAPDPAIEGLPYATGHGRPTVVSLGLADGAPVDARPLVETAVRGGAVELAGGVAAWPRLRVDGDRNRTEVELTAEGVTRRLTRAHGFSFCPSLAEPIDGRVALAWIDTRDGREDSYRFVGPLADVPLDETPEPTPAPPRPPPECFAPQAVAGEFVQGMDAVATGRGLFVGWIALARDGEGRAVIGAAEVGGPEAVGAPLRFAVDGEPARVAAAWAGRGLLAVEIDGEVAVFDGGARALTVPGALAAFAASGDEVLVVRRAEDGALSTVLARLDGAGGVVEGAPFRSRAVAAGAVGGALLLARLGAPERVGEPMLIERVSAAGAVEVARLDGGIDPGELRFAGGEARGLLAWSAHAGRAFARDVRVAAIEAAGEGFAAEMATLPGDPAASRYPAPAVEGGRAWVAWLENRPVERIAVHLAVAEAGVAFGAPARVAVAGMSAGDLRLAVVDGAPMFVRRAGVELLVDAAPAACRVPAATAP